MKKAKLATLLAVAALSASAVPLAGVHAADSTLDTTGKVQYVPGTDKTPPTDPSNPDPGKPVGPTDPNGKDPNQPIGPDQGTDGPLSLDFASSLDFGTNRITSADQTYFARAQKYYAANATDPSGYDMANAQYGPIYTQVTDNRGTNAGWTLSVKQNSPLTLSTFDATTGAYTPVTTGTGKTLDGATITFADAEAASNSTDPTQMPTVQAPVVVDGNGNAQPVMSAADQQGAGTWVDRFGHSEQATEMQYNADGSDNGTADVNVDKSVSLYVPGATVKSAGLYYTTLTWTLSATPGN
ncbi:WxL domain-containing protein [Lacticaseibacillus baoqingensis]|uniref:WxL domain-containing protein n=1 Tax=Lacticaseibacillus baoqingensis TaxID=2486013 RepID=A0ABW4EBF1_9LACO|nr:WxL domain-containing protein [Lacticaseibacillus baoqingensis]